MTMMMIMLSDDNNPSEIPIVSWRSSLLTWNSSFRPSLKMCHESRVEWKNVPLAHVRDYRNLFKFNSVSHQLPLRCIFPHPVPGNKQTVWGEGFLHFGGAAHPPFLCECSDVASQPYIPCRTRLHYLVLARPCQTASTRSHTCPTHAKKFPKML